MSEPAGAREESSQGYVPRSDRPHLERIDALKKELGGQVVLLGHHYQRPAIVRRADIVGDSFLLARRAAQVEARWIVFCGVRFMAEAAAVLARPGQEVFHPDPAAGCPMADMADLPDVEEAWRTLSDLVGEENLLPLVYMNSSAALKAFVGERGGLVCTSSNAPRAFRWALERGKRVFFLPDEHLGRNTARRLGIPPGETPLYVFGRERGDLEEEEIRRGKVFLWSGHCHVHVFFRPEDVERARRENPGCRIIVHPECPVPVVEAADEAGSTERIVRFVREGGPGSTTVVGTEINLVERLALDFPDRRVLPLGRSLCPNMYRITPRALASTLEGLAGGDPPPPVRVEPSVRAGAARALERMLALPAEG